MNSSKQEHFAWISLVATVIAMAYYTLKATTLPNGMMIPLAWVFVQIVLWMILVHSAIAICMARPFKKGNFEKDERDAYIESKANHVSFILLFAGVNLLLIALLFQVNTMMKPINMAHALFFMTFGAHAVSQLMQIISYRRGA